MVIKPCPDCPFKKDTLKGWLGFNRADEIANCDSFICHKTGETGKGKRKQCAGFMILKQQESTFYRMLNHASRQYLLEEKDSIFPSKEDFINHHK